MKFDEWFMAQFGPDRRWRHTDEQLSEIIRKGDEAREEFAMRQQREALRRAALYAWRVQDKDKE